MALDPLKIYRDTLGVIYNLKVELDQNNIVSDAVQLVKRTYINQTSLKKQQQFAKETYLNNSPFDAKLIAFYKLKIKEQYKNLGGQVFHDSGIVTDLVSFVKNHFEGEALTTKHFPRFKEDIKQAIINEKICKFLEDKMELPIPKEPNKIEESLGSKPGARSAYTVKQQALALYFLLDKVLKILAPNKADVARLLHLLSGKPVPQKENGNQATKDSSYYTAYLNFSSGEAFYSLKDLEFVKEHFESFKDQPGFKNFLSKDGELNKEIEKARARKTNKK